VSVSESASWNASFIEGTAGVGMQVDTTAWVSSLSFKYSKHRRESSLRPEKTADRSQCRLHRADVAAVDSVRSCRVLLDSEAEADPNSCTFTTTSIDLAPWRYTVKISVRPFISLCIVTIQFRGSCEFLSRVVRNVLFTMTQAV